ncbi:glutamate--cysteine ligase [Pseudomonas sp. microsymbiont 2]
MPGPGRYQQRLQLIEENLDLLKQCLRGVERECLRVTPQGQLALSPHPQGLGSALNNAQITTDYAESLLEFITPALADPAQMLGHLDEIHRFAYTQLGDELLWSSSMPCVLPAEEDIPIAVYGDSNIGRFKHVYRKGLALRYGRTMQCIAGIHYNFSLPKALWPLLRDLEGTEEDGRAYQCAAYFALMRNFHRYSWLLLYLFGASPALDKGFLRGRARGLETFDVDTLYLPHATSLRMSDLGYQSSEQANLRPDLNHFDRYLDGLRKALETHSPSYERLGSGRDGEWRQLNANVLQIENEHYASIRPKHSPLAGERPLRALIARGVQYVELRCLDINPLLPLGIDLSEARLLDAFVLFCALEDSPRLDDAEYGRCASNFLAVAKEGRRPGLKLLRHGQPVALQAWAGELLERIGPLATLLDRVHGGTEHAKALSMQRAKVDDPGQTPSAQVLASMIEHGESFAQFSLRQSHLHAANWRAQRLPAERQQAFERLARDSLAEQACLERQDLGDFAQFVAAYQAQVGG